jgi:formamidopyrimidine-DNA glycosylase
MPEGPQVARYARLQNERLAGRRVRVDSPSGRSDEIAEIFDGETIAGVAAIGKHLLYDFGDDRYLHVHLGRFGRFIDGPLPEPELRGIVRLRLRTADRWYELRGATAVDVYGPDDLRRLKARIGPNPLDPRARPKPVYDVIAQSDAAIGLLLMDQAVIAGVGNIYRCEVLFLNRIHPKQPGSTITAPVWRAVWRDLRRLMTDNAVDGRIVTTAPSDRAHPRGAVRSSDRFYVYHRAGLPCRQCGAIICEGEMGNRTIFWCPQDQPEPRRRRRLS